jgi:hypothetical protein
MKGFSLPVIWVLFSLAGAGEANSQPLPALEYKLTNLDFDTLREEQGPVERRFIVYSKGTSPLRLLAVKPGCGCTTADYTHGPIAPGDSGFIAVVYDPANRPGPFYKTIFIETNDPENLQTYLTISGYVVPRPRSVEERFPVRWGKLRSDRQHIAFGDVFDHEQRTDTLRIVNTANSALSVKKPRGGFPSWYSLSMIPSKLGPGAEGKLILNYETPKRDDWGLIYDTIRFFTTESKDSLRYFTVGINILEDFSKLTEEQRRTAAQARVDRLDHRFGSVKKGVSVQDSVMISNTGGRPLVIRKITSSCECLVWELENTVIPPGGAVSLKFSMDSKGLFGRQHKVLTLITNSPETQVIRINLTGSVG